MKFEKTHAHKRIDSLQFGIENENAGTVRAMQKCEWTIERSSSKTNTKTTQNSRMNYYLVVRN